MRKINKIIIHNTDSEWGDVEAVNAWHKQRGWEGIGYHFLITNAYPKYQDLKQRMPQPQSDGMIMEGREIWRVGAHTKGHNYDSIGIALVGINTFTKEQINSLVQLLKLLMKEYSISIENVYGHYEFNYGKSCPNISMDYLRLKIFK